MTDKPAPWPPRLIFNSDGNWLYYYFPDHDPEALTHRVPLLADAGVDAFSVLAGIDNDLSWVGVHGEVWGDACPDWDPDRDPDAPGVGGQSLSKIAQLNRIIHAIIDDGHDQINLCIDAARRRKAALYVSFRMNDGHTCYEANGWYGRSRFKLDNPHLLQGSPAPEGIQRNPWNFSWRWNYAMPEVRHRCLGVIRETLERYDVDGVELDFCRELPLFKRGEGFENIPVMTDFMRQVRELFSEHNAARGKDVKLIVRVPAKVKLTLGEGIDTLAWAREGLADLIIVGSISLTTSELDIAEVVEAARPSNTLVYIGLEGAAHLSSPMEGYETSVPPVLRAVADNAYRQGAAGAYIFNYDYRGHRAGVADPDKFDKAHLELLRELGNPEVLKRRNRAYCATDSHICKNYGYAPGDPRPQMPRRLALVGRGANKYHAIHIQIADDIKAGLAEGRIKRCELRVRLVGHENYMDRVICEVNGQRVSLDLSRKIANQWDDTWLIVDNPPVKQGDNEILLVLDGIGTPDPWPTVEQCEIVAICEQP